MRIKEKILLSNVHFSFQKGKKPLKGRNNLKILIACEESQTVCAEMHKLGHEAYSADIQKPSGGHPEWHILGDVLPLINGKCRFTTMDGTAHQITGKWDLIIAHPPCTYLTSAGACRLMPKGKLDKKRLESGIAAKEFFLKFYYADCDKICIENPAPMKIYSLPPYSQIIQPYMFGENVTKRTCLWLKNLEPLIATNDLGRPETDTYIRKNGEIGYKCWTQQLSSGKSRSKTFPGIAQAMAKQWCGNAERQVKYFQSWSGGKDSTASIILEHIYGLPQSKIIMSEVMFDRKRDISGELPEHMEWVHDTAIPLFRSWGYEVEILRADKDYLDLFFHKIEKSKVTERIGKARGFLLSGRCDANRDLKIKPINGYYKNIKEDFIQYVGIAADEPKRLERLQGTNMVSLLAKYGYTEQLAYNLCKKFGLLSPVYNFSKRGGCWFCPNSSTKEFAHTKSEHPELWEELRRLSLTDNRVSNGFKYEKTFDEVDRAVDYYLNRQKL